MEEIEEKEWTHDAVPRSGQILFTVYHNKTVRGSITLRDKEELIKWQNLLASLNTSSKTQ